VISEEFEANDQKLQLASKLLDQKRFDDARRVLDNVTKDAPRSTASALRGRLAALQGDCKTAIRLFDQADSESEPDCVFMEDRKLCEATQK
jgi:predicted negative regulator of RcsB-dependent stress response